MGTRRAFKVEVIGPESERSIIESAIKADEDLTHSLNQWDRHIRNWTPDSKLEEISKQCDRSYILLKTAEEASECHETVFYQGAGLNAYHPTIRRNPPMTYVKKLRTRVLNRKRAKNG